jgi:thiol-disulfide isomerase/thioredoxin
MARTVLLAVLSTIGIVGQFAPLIAGENAKKDSSREKQAAATLKVGDLAPALKATRWLQGDPVKRLERGKIYVVEFWATWCGALHSFMPLLAELQARYREQGVTIIAFTCRDIRGEPDNTEEKVSAFVKKRARGLRYTFAYADDGTTADAWLKAAGQRGFCTFVVDRAGRIAYMGHPMFLNLVLPKVIAGVSPKAVSDEMARVVAEYQATHDTLVRTYIREPRAGLRALKEFEAKYPQIVDLLPMVRAKLSLLPKHGGPGQGKDYAETQVAKALKRRDVAVLELVYSILRNEKESKEFLALALRAAEAHVRIDGGRDAHSLLNLADAHLLNGHKAKAKEYARRAIAAAAGESDAYQQHIEKAARRLGAVK